MDDKAYDMCAKCSKPTKKLCSDCKSVSYCSEACRNSDLKAHKDFCKERQLPVVLKRAADLIHEVYLDFRVKTWDMEIEKVEAKTDAIEVFDKLSLKKNLYYEFPENLMETPDVRAAVLCNINCEDALAYMHHLISELLEGKRCSPFERNVLTCAGWVAEIYEPLFLLPMRPRLIMTIRCGNNNPLINWPNFGHTVLRVTSHHSRKVWYIDLTGSQYGFRETLLDANAFNDQYSRPYINDRQFGFCKQMMGFESQKLVRWGAACRTNLEIAKHMAEAINKWTQESGTALPDLLKCDQLDFDAKRAWFLSDMNNAVGSYLARTDVEKIYRGILAQGAAGSK